MATGIFSNINGNDGLPSGSQGNGGPLSGRDYNGINCRLFDTVKLKLDLCCCHWNYKFKYPHKINRDGAGRGVGTERRADKGRGWQGSCTGSGWG